jgi:hypothetical protein
MHFGFATINYLRWLEQRQILQPQACRLGFAVAKPPRLDDLMGGGDGSADNAHRILDAPPIYWCRHQQAHEVQRLNLLLLLTVKVPAAANRKMRAWRMRHHQIPAISLAPPQPVAADAIAGQPRTPADHSSMRHARACEMHRGRGRCIHRQLRRALRVQRRRRSLQLDEPWWLRSWQLAA